MKLSTRGRYAVMAMVDLASHAEVDRPVSLADIAERQEISHSYLEQLFGKLRRNELVKSVRGPGGGYVLGRASETIYIAEIVLTVDEPLNATRCSSGSGKGCQSGGGRCATHDLWEELTHQIHLFLRGVSLADVLLCRVKSVASALNGQSTAGQAAEKALAVEHVA